MWKLKAWFKGEWESEKEREVFVVMLEHKIFNYSINIFEMKNPEWYQVDFDCEISKCGLKVVFEWGGEGGGGKSKMRG